MFDQAKTDDPPLDHGQLLDVLARADAFASLSLTRRDVLWAVRGFADRQLPLLDTSPDKARK